MRTPLEKIQRACARIAWRQPFFGAFIMRFPVEEMPDHLKGQCTTMCTNGRAIYWAPEFVAKISDDEVEGVIIHEIFHIIFKHAYRLKRREPKKWNIACDYTIDPMVHDLPGVALPKLPGMEMHHDSKYDGHHAEHVYELLPDQDQQGGASSIGEVIQPTTEDGKPLSQSEADAEMQDVDRMTVQAADAAKRVGKMPGCMKQYIDSLLEPKVDWEARIRTFVGGENPEGYTYKRPHRAQFWHNRMIEPSVEKTGVEKMVICIDVSGSVSDKEIAQFLGEMNHISEEFQPEEITVIQHDTDVRRVDVFERGDIIDALRIEGRGGTCVQPTFKYIEDHIDHPDRIIWMTDMGIGDWGDDPGYQVLWVATMDTKAPYGETVYIKID